MTREQESAVLDRMLDPVGRCLTPDAARQLIALRANPSDQARIDELADKCTEDDLTPEEIADEMQLSVERVKAILKMAQQPISMQATVGDSDDACFGDFIEDKTAENPADMTSYSLLKDKLSDVLGTVAGDDTIILVCASATGGGPVATDLATLAGL